MADTPLKDCTIAVLAEDDYEDLELWYPVYRLREAGARVEILGTGKESYQGKKGTQVVADWPVTGADPSSFDAVVIPGGFAPDRMRRHPAMVEFVRSLGEAGKLVAFICHAGWVPVSAGLLKGREVTSFPSIRDDLENAGARWVDEPVVRDGNLISSRVPDDLPVFCRTLIAALQE